MSTSLFGLLKRSAPAARLASCGTPARRYFRPSLDPLEERVVLASAGSMTLPLDVTGINVVGTGMDRQLQGVVSLAGQATDTVPITLGTVAVVGEECPILHLELGPIDLDLLGLQVETSAICLDITAVDHQGLLGGLLCDLAGGLDLGGILDGLLGQVDTLLDRLEGLLDDVLGQAFTVTDVFGTPVGGGAAAQQEEGVCDILSLSLGPIDLDVPLLGVSVELDNCEGGPITVDVTADPEGGLLGSLLCGIAGLDLGVVDLGGLIDRVDRLIDRLTDLADRLDDLPDLSRQIERLIDQVQRIADRIDDLRDLDRLIDRVDRLIDRLDRLIDRLG